MIQSPEDLASLMAEKLRMYADHEADATEPRAVSFVTPPRAVFLVHTVEGRAFRVTVQEESEP